ncbi:MAG TPA: adenylate/guanylate cyclase domain-containing protein [Polyangiaceae bacterium]
MIDTSSLFDWLVDGAPGAKTAPEVVLRMGDELVAAGVPVERMGAFVSTLHPQIVGRAFTWTRGQPVKVGELSHALLHSDMFKRSPIAHVMTERTSLRFRVKDGEGTTHFPVVEEFAREGYTDYAAFPMLFLSGEAHAITFSTKDPNGFSDEAIAAIAKLVGPLSRVAEILALRRTAANLLSTYVGRNTGERILAGRIVRGDIETVRAVIWFSDLRGFTEMSSRLTPREVIDTLNELFECQVPAIEKRGGEVLKFIGDGMLAIFPIAEGTETSQLATAALEAADEAFGALAAHNAKTTRPLQFGLALHVGDIAYGNIGGANRLDFTAIGSAVNLAARLEGLTGKLGKALVVSEALAAHTSRALEEVGSFELKGVPGKQRVFAPRG